jgi:hypothetical protein
LLRVGDEHAGKQARCPECNTIYVVPGESSATASVQPRHAPQWYLRTPESRVFGPVDRETMDTWVSQGRVTSDCQLRADDELRWRPADEVYGILRAPAPHRSTAQGRSVRSGHAPATTPFRVPHRGVLVLLLGIFGWIFCCPIFSVVAWSLGNSDLREMRLGRMDPAGEGLTRAGRVMGMVHTLMFLALTLLGFFLLILATVS